jgi:hypothetical protein
VVQINVKRDFKIHNLKLNGEFKTCGQCITAKYMQKNVNKDWKGGIQVSGEQFYLDIFSIKDLSYG